MAPAPGLSKHGWPLDRDKDSILPCLSLLAPCRSPRWVPAHIRQHDPRAPDTPSRRARLVGSPRGRLLSPPLPGEASPARAANPLSLPAEERLPLTGQAGLDYRSPLTRARGGRHLAPLSLQGRPPHRPRHFNAGRELLRRLRQVAAAARERAGARQEEKATAAGHPDQSLSTSELVFVFLVQICYLETSTSGRASYTL